MYRAVQRPSRPVRAVLNVWYLPDSRTWSSISLVAAGALRRPPNVTEPPFRNLRLLTLIELAAGTDSRTSVSYTHLTLPTTPYV